MIYYHGTSSEESYIGICRNGFKYDTELVNIRYKDSPDQRSISNSIYLTKSIGNAIRYSLMFYGNDHEHNNPYGYIFKCDISECNDFHCDEDELGSFVLERTCIVKPTNVSFSELAKLGKANMHKYQFTKDQIYQMFYSIAIKDFNRIKILEAYRLEKPKKLIIRNVNSYIDYELYGVNRLEKVNIKTRNIKILPTEKNGFSNIIPKIQSMYGEKYVPCGTKSTLLNITDHTQKIVDLNCSQQNEKSELLQVETLKKYIKVTSESNFSNLDRFPLEHIKLSRNDNINISILDKIKYAAKKIIFRAFFN